MQKSTSFFVRIDDNENISLIDFSKVGNKDYIFRYVVLAFHIGPTTGRPHWHFFIQSRKQVRYSAVRKFLNIPRDVSCNIQTPKCNMHAIKYVKNIQKAAEPIEEYGKYVTQGKRTDLEEFCEDIRSSNSMYEIVKKQPVNFLKFGRMAKEMFNIIKQRQANKFKERAVESWIFWGVTGKGKTTDAIREFLSVHKLKDYDYYLVPKPKQYNNIWFDNYDGQSVIILDEFDETWVDSDVIKHLTDKWIRQFPVKGGFIQSLWDYVIFTSNYDPESWKIEWTDSLLRRIPKNHWIEY